MKRIILAALIFTGCGGPEHIDKRTNGESETEILRRELFKLQQELAAIVESDYATCAASLSQAAQNICAIAQAATVEARLEMQGALSDLAAKLESEINDTQVDVQSMSGMWKRIYGVDFPETVGAAIPTEADCAAFNANASVMECVKVQGDAIQAIEDAIDSLTGVVSGTMIPVSIGEENITAGPVYESVVRIGDQSRINAYADGLGNGLTLGGNPLTSVNGSPTLTITSTAHGLTAGNFVSLEGCQSGKGFTTAHLNNEFEVVSALANTFTITMPTNATSGGAFGASSCLIRKYTGNGFTTIWEGGDGSDLAVRKTTSGTKSYQFAICETTGGLGKVCYSTSNRIATFATISAIPGWDTTCLSAGAIVCK